MSGALQCERHAQFHRRKRLKASSRSDSMSPPSVRFLLVFVFPRSFCHINSKLFSSRVFTLCCFHYANTKRVAALLFFLHLFRWEMRLRKLTCLPLAGTYEKLFFKKCHQSRTDRTTCRLYRKPSRWSQFCVRKRFPFLASRIALGLEL